MNKPDEDEAPKTLTYAEIGEFIANLSEEDRQQHAAVYLTQVDELIPIHGIAITVDSDDDPCAGILDEGGIYLKAQF